MRMNSDQLRTKTELKKKKEDRSLVCRPGSRSHFDCLGSWIDPHIGDG